MSDFPHRPSGHVATSYTSDKNRLLYARRVMRHFHITEPHSKDMWVGTNSQLLHTEKNVVGICLRGMVQRHVSPLHHARDLQKFSPRDMSREIKPNKIYVTCRGEKFFARFVLYKFKRITTHGACDMSRGTLDPC